MEGGVTSLSSPPSPSWVSDLRHKNPLDHKGRSASVIALMLSKNPVEIESFCPECGDRLRLCAGDEVEPYLAHFSSDAEHRCTGSLESVWHLAAKRAAERLDGWSTEQRYTIEGRVFRADAMNSDGGKVLEFVHTLSDSYVAKHLASKSHGMDVTWLFDGAAAFCKPQKEDDRGRFCKALSSFDYHEAQGGRLVLRARLRQKARKLVGSLGLVNCFIHFHGMAFQCSQCKEDADDVWSFCRDDSLVGSVVYGDGGLNDQLIRDRAGGIGISHLGLGTYHTPEHEKILEEVRGHGMLVSLRQTEKRQAIATEMKRGGNGNESRWVAPEDWPGTLVNLDVSCRCGSQFGVDVPIHGNRSLRRDCAVCSKFLLHVKWYGVDCLNNDIEQRPISGSEAANAY